MKKNAGRKERRRLAQSNRKAEGKARAKANNWNKAHKKQKRTDEEC